MNGRTGGDTLMLHSNCIALHWGTSWTADGCTSLHSPTDDTTLCQESSLPSWPTGDDICMDQPIDRWERRKVHALCWSCSSAAAAAAHGSLIGPTMLAHWRELLVFESSSRALSQPDWGNWDDERAFYGISSMTGLIALRFALVWTDEFPQFS